MNRHERIRFFISEQCRRKDTTFRNYLFPKQVMVGNSMLPVLEGSSLTFRLNTDKKMCFRIRIAGDEELGREQINIGFQMSQVESISIKDSTKKHPVPALVFILTEKALTRMIDLCCPYLDGIRERCRHSCRYLTVILGNDPLHANPNNNVFCRIAVLANKFTFPFKMAKIIMMHDLPLMWEASTTAQTGHGDIVHFSQYRESIADMDDEAWDWLMSFLNVRYTHCPRGGYWFEVDDSPPPPESAPRRPWSLNTEHEYLLRQRQIEAKAQKLESTPESPESSSDSNSNFDQNDHQTILNTMCQGSETIKNEF